MLRQEIIQMDPAEQIILRPGLRPIRAKGKSSGGASRSSPSGAATRRDTACSQSRYRLMTGRQRSGESRLGLAWRRRMTEMSCCTARAGDTALSNAATR